MEWSKELYLFSGVAALVGIPPCSGEMFLTSQNNKYRCKTYMGYSGSIQM